MPLDQSAPIDQIDLLLPSIKCAGCIGPVERALHATPGVRSARVNLTKRRVHIEIEPGKTTAEALCSLLDRAGYSARPFDPRLHAAM